MRLRKPSKVATGPHPVIVKAGLADDPVFGKRTTLEGMTPATVEWIKNRYQRLCAACGKKEWTSPRTLPICRDCWLKLPLDVCMWWWSSKRTQRMLERLLDEYFDGGYKVPADYHQLRKMA